MRWNWQNKPRYKGQVRPSDDGRFPAVGLAGGNRHDLTLSCRSQYSARNRVLLSIFEDEL